MNNILIIIPTYNESLTIIKTIESIFCINKEYYILVVDDNSPDNTSKIVQNYITKSCNNVKLLNRSMKGGIGSAYVEGFKYAIKNKYNKVIQIDADLSHNPSDIPRLINESHENDLVIGSRYIGGIRIINWPISRLFLSFFGNQYARLIIGIPILDVTGGFKCIKTTLLKDLNLKKIKSEGYAFQIEINYLAWIKRYKIKEIPIVFTDRNIGVSKMSKRIIFEAVYIVPYLKLKKILKIFN